MGANRVNPVNGKYTIRGKDGRNLELALEDSDLNKYIVEELDGADMDAKLPSSNPENINWFACFSVYNNDNGQNNGYASVYYWFPVTLEPDQRFFVAYNGQAHEVTNEVKNTGRVRLNEGDPGTGTAP